MHVSYVYHSDGTIRFYGTCTNHTVPLAYALRSLLALFSCGAARRSLSEKEQHVSV